MMVNPGLFGQTRKVKWLVAALSVFVCSTEAAAAESGIGFELTADYFSKYIWRGQNLDDDNVFQTGLSAIWGGLTASIWGNMELTSINNNRNEYTELDYSLDYSGDIAGLNGVGYSVGLIYYDFPNTDVMDTTEAYWGLSLDLPLSPSMTCYHDLDEVEGTYISLGVGYSAENIIELGSDVPVAIETGVSLGWGSGSYNKYYWGADKSKINDLVLSASFPYEITGWKITPSVHYVTLLSGNIRETDIYDTASDYFLAGVSLLKRF